MQQEAGKMEAFIRMSKAVTLSQPMRIHSKCIRAHSVLRSQWTGSKVSSGERRGSINQCGLVVTCCAH